MVKVLTPEKIDEFNRLKRWVRLCPIEAAMRIEELEEENKKLKDENYLLKIGGENQ